MSVDTGLGSIRMLVLMLMLVIVVNPVNVRVPRLVETTVLRLVVVIVFVPASSHFEADVCEVP